MTATATSPHRLLQRHFAPTGRQVDHTVAWTRRDVEIIAPDGTAAFSQRQVEFPKSWSDQSATIVASKYFRGTLGTDEREHSLRQVLDRVVGTITHWGTEGGYFDAGEDEDIDFAADLRWLLLHQRVAFNSPVWFNIGVADVPQQASACFIVGVDDSMDAILEWIRTEGRVFRSGSGSGVNLSRIRGSMEPLRGGGTASGPVSFMAGADSSAGAIKSGGKTRRAAKMVLLDDDHPDIERFIWCKAIEERKARVLAGAGYDMGLDGDNTLQFQNANNSVRVSDAFMEAVVSDGDWDLIARTTGEVTSTVRARDLFRQIAEAAWECADPGVHFTTTIQNWHTCPATGPIRASNPCSEYMHVDNSACNLASINLLSYLAGDGVFDVAGFRATVRTLIVAQDILVGRADYPTRRIAETSTTHRQLGLGFTNLGAALMAQGIGYDTAEGRGFAGAVTALMTGAAYAMSVELAARIEPFAAFAANREAMLQVLDQHHQALRVLGKDDTFATAAGYIVDAAGEEWTAVSFDAPRAGVRNAQATAIAPTGTISFMMGASTTGIEPDFALVKYKRLVGGGTMQIVNDTVERALSRLGYTEPAAAAITEHIAQTGNIIGAPGLDPQHHPVFATSVGENYIDPQGHVTMLAAVQPFISGAISKTVNVPETATVDDIADVFLESWRLGLKSVAVYRDGSKLGQPLGTDETETSSDPHVCPETRRDREELPAARDGRTTSFQVLDAHGYLIANTYEDGRVGEIFLKASKQGSTLEGLLDAVSIAVSHGLQYGVPLRTYVEGFMAQRWDPAGRTDDNDIPFATSLIDYVARRLALDHLDPAERAQLGIYTIEERNAMLDAAYPPATTAETSPPAGTEQPAANSISRGYAVTHAPFCASCGTQMVPSGSCYCCPGCGSTSGCS